MSSSASATLFQDLLYTVNDGIATITINRPSSLNSLTGQTYAEIRQALEAADRDESVLITVLTGNGRYFSAGADVSGVTAAPKMVDNSNEAFTYYQSRMALAGLATTAAAIEHRKVLVVVLNGPVVGFPAGFIGAADIIYAAESASLHAPFVAIGACPEGSSSANFMRKMGPSMAAEALLFGRKFSAKELLSIGFVSRVFPDATIKSDVEAILKQVVAGARANSLEMQELARRFASGDTGRAFGRVAAALAASKVKAKI